MKDNHVAMGLVQLLLAGIVMVINQKFFISGFKSLWHRSPNMDTLVALGSDGILLMECVCSLCNDQSTGGRQYGSGHGLYAWNFILNPQQ